MKKTFVDYTLRLIEPSYNSKLVDSIIELDHLRRLRLSGDTPVHIFYQVKDAFHMLESLESARIEGNRTTISEYIDTKIRTEDSDHENIWELKNIERAMSFIENTAAECTQVTHTVIRELHKITVEGLKREGDKTPGAYRTAPVAISGATHTPPDPSTVQAYMDELIDFINEDDPAKYDLLKIALTHHRFTWIHPFSNGNGRVVRLLTYFLLIKYGFNVGSGRILNPTAVFCNNREKYYEMLSIGDKGTDKDLEEWAFYMLSGMKDELSKVDQLTDYKFLCDKILKPALKFSKERAIITEEEKLILDRALDNIQIKANDLNDIFPKDTARQRSYKMKKLIDARMLMPIKDNARIYTIHFIDNALIRGVMKSLQNEGFTSALD